MNQLALKTILIVMIGLIFWPAEAMALRIINRDDVEHQIIVKEAGSEPRAVVLSANQSLQLAVSMARVALETDPHYTIMRHQEEWVIHKGKIILMRRDMRSSN